MRKLILFLGIVFTLTGCTKAKDIACDIGELAVAQTASVAASTLGCTELAEIQKDFKEQFVKWGRCPAQALTNAADRSVGSDICDAFTGFAIGAVAQTVIPSKWKCSPTATVDMLKSAAKIGCQKVFP